MPITNERWTYYINDYLSKAEYKSFAEVKANHPEATHYVQYIYNFKGDPIFGNLVENIIDTQQKRG